MAEKLEPKKSKQGEEFIELMTLTQDAFINLLDRKGIVPKKELLEEVNKIRKTLESLKRKT